MKIYHYDFETGIYLGEGLADISPLEEGVWLIPAQATEIAPPEFSPRQYAAFVNNQWVIEAIPEIKPEEALEVEPPRVIL
jgi:hypothetical protein